MSTQINKTVVFDSLLSLTSSSPSARLKLPQLCFTSLRCETVINSFCYTVKKIKTKLRQKYPWFFFDIHQCAYLCFFHIFVSLYKIQNTTYIALINLILYFLHPRDTILSCIVLSNREMTHFALCSWDGIIPQSNMVKARCCCIMLESKDSVCN